MKEEWRNVIGFEKYYQVSNLGNVRSLDRISNTKLNSKQIRKGKILSQGIDKYGYCIVGLCDIISHTKTVHRLVANVFINNPDNKKTINHIDGNKKNNNVSNLEWVSYSENHKHAFLIGLKSHSGNNSNSKKINESQVL